MDWKEYWEIRSDLPPWPHAEEATVAELAVQLGLDPQATLERIRKGGYPEAQLDQRIDEIAASEGQQAMAVFRLFPEAQNRNPGRGRGQGLGGGGWGRRNGGGWGSD
jgi:hypothetical protein